MTADMPPNELLNRFKVPPQDLDTLSFCAPKAAKVADWVRALPMTRISFVSSLLYKALPEIGRLKTTPQVRLDMLEALRPAVQQAIQGLTPQFLNQPLILPETARKTATVAQALQKHMSNAYLVTVRELGQATKGDAEALQNQRALALHRAMTGLGLLLLRSYQLYTPVPSRLWLEIHTLYQLAEQWQVHRQAVTEPLPGHQQTNTIERCYQRLLLLASARPNQLRQTEVSNTYDALEQLAPLAHMVAYDPAQEDNLFAVVLDSDSAPLYKSRLPEAPGGAIRELDTGPVVTALEEARASLGTRPGGGRDNLGLTLSLNEHLSHSWHLLAQRSFERRASGGQMNVTIGLSNVHFQMAGGQPFKLFMNQATHVHREENGLFGGRLPTAATAEPDPWGSAFDAGGGKLAGDHLATFNIENNIRQRQQQDYRGEHPTFQVPIVDVSLGGYCLEWREQVPTQLKAGELLGLQEVGRLKWSIGVVRWVQQSRESTLIGVQTLAPQATPLGAAVIYKTGGFSEFLRALEIPPLKAINQPATLITNAVTFHEYSKVRLYRRNSGQQEDNHRTQTTVQLTRRRFSTGAISQFEFRELMPGQSDAGESDDL
ncbi:hypothetical protein EDC38_1920 [Marinimicrobium koreense]|uniref:PilZ domain-containing protein n=1 Tax=Marinimicrobium koreense TaxID=306545 RepID=A0A3N1P243_9GAMM|nr:hypothetical protein [Marinimicrobium koreense]ROQ21297.1 hypothetical protein EDC38_1920 [Marinimicrobium koreense]